MKCLKEIQVDLSAGNDASRYLSFYKTIEDYTLALNFREEWAKEAQEKAK